MKVLILAANDSDNLMICNILFELERRGHTLKIFALQMDGKSIRMFAGLKAPIAKSSEISEEDIIWADCIFSALRAHIELNILKEKVFCNKYIYVYNNYIDNTWYTPGADFMFTCGTTRHPSHMEDCASMPIGCPKNDRFSLIREEKHNHRLLFIDSGHFPFSHIGKRQVADIILQICEKYPDYELIVKPRFLPEDTNMLHANSEHLYHILQERSGEGLPENLILLQEYCDMQELLDECNCALMLCSSAYIDAALRNRNMLIIKGIENEDKYELRNEIEYKNIYRLREESGCVVDYRNVCDYLPDGIACREEHLNKVVTYREDASVHIVDVMEYIYQKFLSRGLFPAILQYNYETYQSEMNADIALTWNQIKSKRIKNMGNNALNVLNRVIASINFKPLFEMIDTQYDRYETTVDGARQFLSDCQNLRREILIANREKLMRDPLDQAELLRALYDLGQYDEILEMPCEEILCIGAWNYYTGMLLYNRGNYPASMKHFQAFLKEANTRNFAKYDCEWTGLKTVYCRVARICHEVTLTPEDFAELYEEMFVKKIEGSVPYEERKCLYQFACSMAPVLHKRAQYEMAAKCMYRCMREGEFFRDDKKRADSLQLELNHVYRSLAWRIGCKILSVPQKISWWIHFMRDNGCVCTWKQMIKYIHGKLKATHVYRIKETFQKNILPGYEVYSRMLEKFGDDSWLEVGALGTGNIYICGLYYIACVFDKH